MDGADGFCLRVSGAEGNAETTGEMNDVTGIVSRLGATGRDSGW